MAAKKAIPSEYQSAMVTGLCTESHNKSNVVRSKDHDEEETEIPGTLSRPAQRPMSEGPRERDSTSRQAVHPAPIAACTHRCSENGRVGNDLLGLRGTNGGKEAENTRIIHWRCESRLSIACVCFLICISWGFGPLGFLHLLPAWGVCGGASAG